MTQQHWPCVLVEVSGPDPKLVKSASAPFHAGKDGRTRLSSSGVLVTATGLQSPLVATGLTALYPFLTQPARQNLLAASQSSLVNRSKIEGFAGEERAWFGLRLVGIWEAPGVRQVLATLLQAPSVAGHGGWRVGWPSSQQHQQNQNQRQEQQQAQWGQAGWQAGQGQGQGRGRVGGVQWAALAPYVAILAPEPGPAMEHLQSSALALDSMLARALLGEQIRAVGSPFGVLAPAHFFGFVSTGIISNLFNSEGGGHTEPSLLAADLRCLPGMEGGAVLGNQGQLLGMLGPPLTSASAQAQLALVIPVTAVAAAVAVAVAKLAREVLGGVADSNPAGAAGAAGTFSLPQSPPALRSSLPLLALPQQRHGEGAAVAAAAAASPHRDAGPGIQKQLQQEQQQQQQLGGLGAALQSVVAVAVGTSWASGVIISPQGHVLTNAHLFEPRGHPSQLRLAPPAAPAIKQAPSAAGPAAETAVFGSLPAYTSQQEHQEPAPEPPIPPGAASALWARHLTNAPQHLLQLSLPGSCHHSARVLVQHPKPSQQLSSMSGPGPAHEAAQWHAADVLYIFKGPLDLAVLQLRPAGPSRAPYLSEPFKSDYLSPSMAAGAAMAWPSSSPGTSSGSGNGGGGDGSGNDGGGDSSSSDDSSSSSSSSSDDSSGSGGGNNTDGNRAHGPRCAGGPWPALRLASEEEILPGVPACVAGYPLFNPSGQLGPWVTQGNVARVLLVGGQPAMLLTTAGVHSGASGGAVLDPRSGSMLGLVTSNAKHADGAIYPHLNFSIPAGLLRPLYKLAAGSTAGAAASLAAACAVLDAELAMDAKLCALWGLTFSAAQWEGEGAGQGSGPRQGPGAGFGGGRPPQALTRLLEELGRREEASQQEGAGGRGQPGPKSKL